jgi:hypothetical protein
MPCQYVIDADQRLVITTGWGRLTFYEAKAHQAQLLSDAAFNPEYDQLLDLTAVSGLDMTADQAETLASRVVFSARSRRALVATDPVVFGMGRLMEAHHELATRREQTRVFRDREAALDWIRSKPRS